MNKERQKEIARRLRLVRQALGLSQIEIATELGISPQRWWHYEAGKRPFDIDVACLLCQRWPEVPLEWLFIGWTRKIPKRFMRQLLEA